MTHFDNDSLPHDPEFAAELLALIDFELGTRPINSLVVVARLALDIDRQVVGICGSLPLELTFAPARMSKLRESIVRKLSRDSPYLGYLVVYCSDYFDEFGDRASSEMSAQVDGPALTRELAHWCDEYEFDPERIMIVGSERWRCLKCRIPGHCPRLGRELSELASTQFALQANFDELQENPALEKYLQLPLLGRDANWQHGFVRTLPRNMERLNWRTNLTQMWLEFISDQAGADVSRSRHRNPVTILSLSLHSIPVRDNVIYALCTGNKPRDFVSLEADRFGEMFESIQQPTKLHTNQALEKLEALAHACHQDYRVPILTVWAWCHWWYGNRAEAQALTQQVLAIDPAYSLAQTLRSVLFRRAMPPWQRAQLGENY